MQTIKFLCDHCGERVECPETDAGQKVLCKTCLRPVKVPALISLEQVELESDPGPCRRGRDGSGGQAIMNVAPPPSPSLTTPAAQPTPIRDLDKALTTAALGIFRLNNWPCQDEPGYRAFTARVKFHSTQLGVTTVDDFRVFGERGLLVLESPVLELPALPGVPVPEALNEINQRSVSSVFVLDDRGVHMRCALLPRAREEGFLTGAMILQALRQMNHDRRHALSLLRTVVESGRLDPVEVARAFAQPLAPCALRSFTLDQALDLALFAGFHAQEHAGQVALSRTAISPERRSVRIVATPGFLRGWADLGEPSQANPAWALVPNKIRSLCTNLRFLARDPREALEQLNRLNASAGLVRFVLVRKHVLATATAFPTDQLMSVELLKVWAGALVDCAEQNAPAVARPRAKLAG
ncbi:MAG: hypothetical protein NTW87_04375 [Planctomycetota bacterium]|nr:hypothetical protein [Planctomycetota bacterium]